MKKLSIFSLLASATIACLFSATNSSCMDQKCQQGEHQVLTQISLEEFNKAHGNQKPNLNRRLNRQHLLLGTAISTITFPLCLAKKCPVSTSLKCALVAGVSTWVSTFVLRKTLPSIRRCCSSLFSRFSTIFHSKRNKQAQRNNPAEEQE
jgi:hypothetical protein